MCSTNPPGPLIEPSRQPRCELVFRGASEHPPRGVTKGSEHDIRRVYGERSDRPVVLLQVVIATREEVRSKAAVAVQSAPRRPCARAPGMFRLSGADRPELVASLVE